MSRPVKIPYRIDLGKPDDGPSDPAVMVRTVAPGDREQLASLMLDAYLDTIDYDGETLLEARREVDDWLGGSTALLEHSFAAVVDNELVSAVLVSEVDGSPFIGYVMTRASMKRRGLARLVTQRALQSLSGRGFGVVTLYVTDGNEPSEALFGSLGARIEPDDRA